MNDMQVVSGGGPKKQEVYGSIATTVDTTGLATSTKQSDGTQKTQVVDGSGNVIGATSNALDVNIKSGAASGTQYADGAVRGTATGTLLMVDDGTNIQSVKGDASGVLAVSMTTVPSHAVTNAGTFAVQATEADGANTTLGAKADAKSTATDTTAVSAMSVLKQISASVQTPPSQAVTNAGTFAVQAAEADGANVTLGSKGDAKSTATDTTAITAMSVLKQISASVQAPPSQAVTNAGTFAVQSTPVTQADTFMLGGVNVKEINAVTPLMGNGVTGTGSQRVTIASDNTAFSVNATLQTGTNSVGKISDITTSVVPGTGATNLGKAEDAAHASGDTGVAVWAVRNDNAATTYSSNDQDYSPFAVDLKGRAIMVQKAATGTQTTVASSATNVTLLAANSARAGASVYNDSTAILYLRCAATATTSNFTIKLFGDDYWEAPAGYTGIIDGIWASATGNARITEFA